MRAQWCGGVAAGFDGLVKVGGTGGKSRRCCDEDVCDRGDESVPGVGAGQLVEYPDCRLLLEYLLAPEDAPRSGSVDGLLFLPERS